MRKRPMLNQGNLVCFEGLDGAGKTTTARKFSEHLSRTDNNVIFVDKKSTVFPSDYVSNHMQLLSQVIWNYPPESPILELGNSHWLYLVAAWFSSLDHCKVRPLLDQGYTVIVDNWFYKFLARFRLKKDIDFAHARSCFRGISIPDRVFFLDIEPSLAAERKKSFKLSETGNLSGLQGNTAENFIIYQGLVREVLLQISVEEKWSVIPVNNLTEDEVVDQAVFAISSISR
jgi:dTMP kinase